MLDLFLEFEKHPSARQIEKHDTSLDPFAYLQSKAAKDLALLEPLVSLGRFFQGINRGKRNLQSGFLNGLGQSGKFRRTGLCVVGNRLYGP